MLVHSLHVQSSRASNAFFELRQGDIESTKLSIPKTFKKAPSLKTGTKRSLRGKRELRPAAAAAHLQSTGGTVFRDMVTTRGRVPAMSARSGGQVLKQERVPKRRHSDTAWMVLTKLRVNLGLTIATMAE